MYAAIGWERTRIALLERLVKPRADVVVPPDVMRVCMTYAMLALDTQCYTPLRATLFQMRATRMCFQYGEQQTTARAYCMNAALSTLSADDRAAEHVYEMLAHAEALIDREKHPAALLELYCSQSTCAMFLGRLADVIAPARAAEELLTSNPASGEHGDYFYVFVVRTARVSALQFLGRHREAAELARLLLDDAEATNNRCAALQVTMARTSVEQVQSCCRGSRARLDAERNELPHTTISVLHLLHVISVIRTACLTGEHTWALEIFADFRCASCAASTPSCSIREISAARTRLRLRRHTQSRRPRCSLRSCRSGASGWLFGRFLRLEVSLAQRILLRHVARVFGVHRLL